MVSGSTVCRVLRRDGFTRTKVQQVAKERCIEFRTAFMAHVLQFPREHFVGVDETGSDARTHIRQFRCLACPWFIHELLQRLLRFAFRARKANLSNRCKSSCINQGHAKHLNCRIWVRASLPVSSTPTKCSRGNCNTWAINAVLNSIHLSLATCCTFVLVNPSLRNTRHTVLPDTITPVALYIDK